MKNLPRDLAETYVRGLNDIPDGDRPFVRRVFLWICGHAQAPWLTQRGINAHVLLSAVSYDLGLRMGIYTIDDVKELCGCLISVLPEVPLEETCNDPPEKFANAGKPLPSKDHTSGSYPPAVGREREGTSYTDSELFVSLAHYTVREFLESTFILDTKAAFYSLPLITTTLEYTESVLRQALQSNPASSATDWVVDREAYCLTLACAIYCTSLGSRPDIQDLFLQYYSPYNPHYDRILAIQRQLLANFDHSSQHYLLQYLPTRVLLLSTMEKAPECITTVLNIRLVCAGSYGADDLVARCLSVYGVQSGRRLLEPVVVVTFCVLKDGFGEVPGIVPPSSNVWQEVTFQGTVDDIVRHVHSSGGQFLGLSYLTFMGTELEPAEGSSSDTASAGEEEWPVLNEGSAVPHSIRPLRDLATYQVTEGNA